MCPNVEKVKKQTIKDNQKLEWSPNDEKQN